jgi:hypothetical protein
MAILSGKIFKSIISKALNFDMNCSYLHESCNLESNKLMFKSIIFYYLTKNQLSLMKVFIFRLFSRNRH